MFLFNKKEKTFKNNKIKTSRKRRKLKVGLALGGGGTKGFAHLGALKAFEENKITFDYIAGCSIGSLVGALISEGMTSDEVYKIAKNYTMKDFASSRIPFVASSTEKMENIIETYIKHNNFKKLKNEFACVAVDLKTGNEVIFDKGNLKKCIAASCSIPGFFQPVKYEDYLLVDGGVKNLLPADVCKKNNCNVVIGIDLSKGNNNISDNPSIIRVLKTSLKIMMVLTKDKGLKN